MVSDRLNDVLLLAKQVFFGATNEIFVPLLYQFFWEGGCLVAASV
jgi:hypothetical protein